MHLRMDSVEVDEERSREAHAGLLFKGFNWLWWVGLVRREGTKLKCQLRPFCCCVLGREGGVEEPEQW